MLTLDIETYFSNEHGISLRKQSMVQYCHDTHLICMGVIDTATQKYDVLWGRDQIREYLEPRLPTVILAQNTVFDALCLKTQIPDLSWHECQFMCTMSMANHLYHHSKLGLQALSELVDSAGKADDVTKFEGLAWPEIFEDAQLKRDMDTYVAQDVYLCWRLFQQLKPEIPHAHLRNINWSIQQFVNPRLALSHRRVQEGLRSMELERRDMLDALAILYRQIPRRRFHNLTSVEMRSRAKFNHVCADFGITIPTKISPTTKQSIPQLAVTDPWIMDNRDNDDITGELIRCRLSYASAIELSRAHTWDEHCHRAYNRDPYKLPAYHFHVMPSGTFTHRLAGRGGFGDNPLNQNRGSILRKAIIPRNPKHTLIGFDFSSLELRIARWVAGDTPSINAVLNDGDIYKMFAAHVKDIDESEVNDSERQVGKTCQLSLQYGVGWVKLQRSLRQNGIQVSDIEARNLVQQFRYDLHDALPAAWARVERYFMIPRSKGLPVTLGEHLNLPGKPHNDGWEWPSGRVLRYRNMRQTQWYNDDSQRMEWRWCWQPGHRPHDKKYTYPSAVFQSFIQSLANEVICEARERLRGAGYDPCMEVYDEMLLCVDPVEWDLDSMLQEVYDLVTAPIQWWQAAPPLDIDIAAGDNYAACH